MTYSTIADMTQSLSLTQRVSAAAASEGELLPSQWASQNIWAMASQPGWAAAWESAQQTATLDTNPDTGNRPGVITDGMILSAVQGIRNPPTPPEETG